MLGCGHVVRGGEPTVDVREPIGRLDERESLLEQPGPFSSRVAAGAKREPRVATGERGGEASAFGVVRAAIDAGAVRADRLLHRS